MRDTYDFKPSATATPEAVSQIEMALASVDTPKRASGKLQSLEKRGASNLAAPAKPATHGGWRVRIYYWSNGGELLCTVTAPMSRIAAENCGKGIPTLRTRTIHAQYNALAPRGAYREPLCPTEDMHGREYACVPMGTTAREIVPSHFGWARTFPGVRLVTFPSEVTDGAIRVCTEEPCRFTEQGHSACLPALQVAA